MLIINILIIKNFYTTKNISITKHQGAVLAFAFVDCVPFTNSLAEQAIRNVKNQTKIAIFRTERGAKVYARIQGFLNTVKNMEEMFSKNY